MRFCFSILFVFGLISCKQKEDPPSETPRTVLTLSVGNQQTTATSRFAGELRAKDRAVLSFEASGVITNLSVDLGHHFEKDDVLGRVDDTRAGLTLESKRAELLNAEATNQEAKLEFERRTSLKGTGAVSVASIEQAETRLESSRARLQAAKAGVASAEKQEADTYLKAPFAGEVVSRLAEPSQVVNSGQPVLEVVGRDAGLEGVISVPDFIRQSLVIGDNASLRVLSLGLETPARITEIGNRTNAAGLFPVILEFVKKPAKVNAGQSIEVAFEKHRSDEKAFYIPVTAYAMDVDEQAYVFVIERDAAGETARVKRRKVNLDELSGEGARIIDGLKADEVIVTKGVELLSDGQQVIAVDQNSQRFGY